jgi:hypothetical protein
LFSHIFGQITMGGGRVGHVTKFAHVCSCVVVCR